MLYSVKTILEGLKDPTYTRAAEKIDDISKLSEYAFCKRISDLPEDKYRNIRQSIRQRLENTRKKIISSIFPEAIAEPSDAGSVISFLTLHTST